MSAINTVTQNFFLRSSIKEITTELGRIQNQITTGLKAQTFADHGPAASRRVISLRNEVGQIDSYLRGIERIDMRAERVQIGLDRVHDVSSKVHTAGMKVTNNLTQPDEMARIADTAFIETYSNLVAEVSGHFVFAGVEADASPLVPFTTLRDAVRQEIQNAVPPDDPTAVLNAVTAFFANEANWYVGGGVANPVEVGRDHPVQMTVRANDPAIRQLLVGFSAMAFSDPAVLGEANYKSLVETANLTVADGLKSTREAVARNGLLRSDLESVQESHSKVKLYAETQLLDIEQVDVFEAVTKLQALQAQLEATYHTTGQLRQLSLANYLR